MRSTDLEWNSADGLKLYAHAWEPETAPKAVICLLHGLGEHIGRYEHAARAFARAGYATLGFDQRGHGRSEGARGFIPSYDALMDDIGLLLEQAGKRYPGLPRFLYGHSMGANEALNYAMRRKPKLAGVIATGPYLRLAFQPSPVKVAMARLMNKFNPAFTQKSGLDTGALSHDKKVVEAYVNDPLVHDQITSNLFLGLQDSGAWALEHAAQFDLPLLLMHGGSDRLTSPDGTREFAKAGGSHITLHIVEDDFHEIHNEPGQEDVFKLMLIWMDARLG